MHHCVKSVQMRSFFWSVFSRIRTEYGEMLRIIVYVFVFSPDAEKYGPEKSPYLDTFRAVHVSYDIHTSTVGYAMKYKFKLIQWKNLIQSKKIVQIKQNIVK